MAKPPKPTSRKPTSRKPAFPSTVTIGDQTLESEALIEAVEAHLDTLLEQEIDENASFETYEQKLLKLVHEIARRKLEKKL